MEMAMGTLCITTNVTFEMVGNSKTLQPQKLCARIADYLYVLKSKTESLSKLKAGD